MNKILVAAVAVLVVGAGGFILLKNQSGPSVLPQVPTQIETSQPTSTSAEKFSDPKKSAHYESNTPEHGSTLAATPVNVVINFNFDLAKGSEIKINMEGNPSTGHSTLRDEPSGSDSKSSGPRDYGVGETVIDKNNLAMRRKMNPDSANGLYTVSYKACWADGSCHDGQFQFKIDRNSTSDFVDMTGQSQITINLQNIAFSPAKVKVSKGTKVTWVNQDDIVHTVNTDSHPAHTYFLAQNSRDLKKGDSYSAAFEDEGIYLYHCTPHASSMRAQILVE